MKILLDECVTKKLKPYLSDYDISTVSQEKWNGLKNGKLLTTAQKHGFNILLSIDKNLQHQQNMENYTISIVILNSNTSKIEDLKEFVPNLKIQLDEGIEEGRIYIIDI